MPTPEANHIQDTTTATVLETVRELVAELRPGTERGPTIALDASFDRDLGLDSLGRVELLHRIERVFDVTLPEQVLASAETPRDLLGAVLAAAKTRPPAAPLPPRLEVSEEAQAFPAGAATLTEALEWHAGAHPQRVHIVLENGDDQGRTIRYGELQAGARAVAAGLQERDLQPGQAVAIMLPTGRDYFYSFFGALLAGGVPVPIYPPVRASQLEEHLRRHAGILSNALAAVLVTVPAAKGVARLLGSQVETLRKVATVQELCGSKASPALYALKGEDTALLQYTSGSTGNPKGVVLSHANLLANIRAMGQAAQVASGDVFVSWLPLYHDMGLIGAWLGSLYHACPFVVMSPLAFLARPERWLWAIHNHRGTLSAAPNFGYELCLRKIEDRAVQGLDLSSWRMAFNGAEPVSPDTLLRFTERFSRYGLRPEAMAPVYGLAEVSVGLAFPPPGRGPLIDRVRRGALTGTGRAVPAESGDREALRIVACGQPLPGHQIRIVDATGHEVGERVEGHLEFKGPSATLGYFRNPEQSRRLFHGEWLDSGDLAYMAQGDVYLTGRAKDVIIRGGRNIYPQELEEAVGDIPGVRRGCVAVFGSPDPVSGTERLVVLAETRETEAAALDALRDRINGLAMDLLGMPADEIALVPAHTVLKTSSGKIRRAASRELYEKGALRRPRRAVRWQVARLALAAALPRLRRALRGGRALSYAVYVWVLFWILAPITWLVGSISPRPAWCWAASRLAARLLLRMSGTPLRVVGEGNLAAAAPCVIAANHASYLDGVVLVAALPRPFGFVAKGELKAKAIPRIFLRRLGAEFVERFDRQRGVEDVQQSCLALGAGKSLIFFPEGTFYRMPGLLPFRMGAFVAAARTGVPVVPVTIRGTRSALRADHWFPRRGALSVVIGAPIAPQGADWDAAVRLRDAARVEILRHCGEPDLGAQGQF